MTGLGSRNGQDATETGNCGPEHDQQLGPVCCSCGATICGDNFSKLAEAMDKVN